MPNGVLTVEKSSLGQLEELNSGGEGTVYRIKSDSNKVFKEFRDVVRNELDLDSLTKLIELPTRFSQHDQAFILEHSVWPDTIVTENNSFVGFLMPIIPDTYFVTHGVRAYPGHSDCDWNKLIMRRSWVGNSNIVSSVPQLEGIPLLDLLIDLSETYAFLHRNQVVAGDVSGRNMVWRARPTPRAVLLDNDGFRIVGTRGVTQPKQSPDWVDPHLNGGDTTIESDQFKLALAVLRGYFGLGVLQHNSKELSNCNDPIGKEIIILAAKSASNGPRPSADEWVNLLKKHRRHLNNAGRPVITVTPPDPSSQPRVTTFIATRPRIKLQ